MKTTKALLLVAVMATAIMSQGCCFLLGAAGGGIGGYALGKSKGKKDVAVYKEYNAELTQQLKENTSQLAQARQDTAQARQDTAQARQEALLAEQKRLAEAKSHAEAEVQIKEAALLKAELLRVQQLKAKRPAVPAKKCGDTDKLFECDLEQFVNNPACEAEGWFKLQLTPYWRERAICRLVEVHFPRDDEPDVLYLVGEYIYKLGGERAIDIVLRYTNDEKYCTQTVINAKDWCLRHRTSVLAEQISAIEYRLNNPPVLPPRPVRPRIETRPN